MFTKFDPKKNGFTVDFNEASFSAVMNGIYGNPEILITSLQETFVAGGLSEELARGQALEWYGTIRSNLDGMIAKAQATPSPATFHSAPATLQ
ncbi:MULTISPECIES: hypothetical protein [unclassified Klebsiella]|uniref:hypothetical protein n=1 Tax=unclassified Klebsiella TaxID=2608929 RepID=UPI0015DBFA9A|nr:MULTISPECIES: hypothetical protein [unclassified Klebsiella]BBR59356.1 hypothetical protein WP4W18E05_27240 [Klebsiella sp. WP4-W18-ESBL-05]BBT71184.1 hypothetical protein WP8S18E06_24830 [Klebsiella sp. WP8-S18-ESBL-06]